MGDYDSTIPNLDAVTTPASTDLLATRQSGDTKDKKVTRAQMHTLESGEHLVLPQVNEAATPTLAFGVGANTGFYEESNGVLRFASEGSARLAMDGNSLRYLVGSNGAAIAAGAATATVPTIIPNIIDADVGIGRAALDQLSLIAGGKEMLRLVETGTATTDQLIIGPAGVIGAAATPSLAFGDGDTGFWENVDDTLNMSFAGAQRYVFSSNELRSADTNGFQLKRAAGSATVPVFTFVGDTDTGVNGTADVLSLIAGGVEALRLSEATGVLWQVECDVGLTADVGSAQGNGVILSTYNVYDTVGTAGDAATLPATFGVGTMVYIKNGAAANSMDVFPASGDDAGAGANTAVAIAAGDFAVFLGTTANATWEKIMGGTA